MSNDYETANKLAAISTALMSDTPVSMAASLLPEGHILDTAAYRDAIRTIRKVIALRSRMEALEARLGLVSVVFDREIARSKADGEPSAFINWLVKLKAELAPPATQHS